MAKENNKATVQKLYDEIIPIVKDIAANTADLLTIKEQLKNVVHVVDLSDIQSDIKEIKYDMKSKISVKAFTVSLSIIVTILTIVILVLEKVIG